MQIKNFVLNNFRCFSSIQLSFNRSVVVIEGNNGSGKTTILEALHYLCYLRSFRTYSPKHLIQFNKEHFFVKVHCEINTLERYDIQAGFTGTKRLVKIDNSSIASFKDLMNYYRVITLTEDDVFLIKGGPGLRRNFIDQALILCDFTFIEQLKLFRSILENRNMLLRSQKIDSVSYEIWTRQLEEISALIQHKRQDLLESLSQKINHLLAEYFNTEITIMLTYKPKCSFSDLKTMEYRLGRSLFGAHLDDFLIHFKNKNSGLFASRGQQKLILVLLKIAQVQMLSESKGPCLFLIDDFLTDFDAVRMEKLLAIIVSLRGQQFITAPIYDSQIIKFLRSSDPHRIKLPI